MYSLSILFSLFIFILVSIITVSFGTKILKIFKGIELSLLSKFIYSFTLGFGVTGYILYFIGLINLFYYWLIWLVLFLILIFSFREFIFWLKVIWEKIKGVSFKSFLKDEFLFLILILVILWSFFVFVGTVSPVIEFDSRWYHFGEAKYYLENHRVSIETFWSGVRTPSIFWPSAFPRLAEVFFAIFLSFKAEIAAKLINFVFGIIGVLAIFVYVRKKAGNLPALISAISIFIAMPFFVNSYYGYIDLIVFGFAAVSFLAIFSWLEKNNIFYLILVAIFSGFVISCKFNGLFILPIFILIIIFEDLFFKKNVRRLLKDLLMYIVVAFIFSFVWYLDNKLHTGSFIYPYEHLNQELGPQGNLLVKISRLFLENVLLVFPLLILFIFGFFRKKLRISILLFFSFLIFYLLWARSSINEPRYLLPGIFGLAVLSGFGFKWLVNYNRAVGFFVKLFVVLILLVNLFLVFRETKPYFSYFIGKKTRHQFLIQVIVPDYWSIYDYNGEIKKSIGNSKALLAGNAWHTYYVDFPYSHASLSGINFFEITSLKELSEKIRNAGFNFLIIKKGDLNDLLAYTSLSDKDIENFKLSPDYDKYFVKVYEDQQALILIYEVK